MVGGRSPEMDKPIYVALKYLLLTEGCVGQNKGRENRKTKSYSMSN
jgi:hypothetical protein